MDDTQGRVAIVTGASRGIGYGVARELLDRGARVCITGRDEDALAEADRSLEAAGRLIHVSGKAHEASHQDEAVARVLDAFGRVDMLVNTVGANPAYGALLDVDAGIAGKAVEINALAALSWVQRCHRAGMAEHGGAVVNISTLASTKVSEGLGIYGASKAMLEQLTRTLAVELAPAVRVNAVAPAVVKTAFAAKMYEKDEEGTAARFPLQRLGTPEDIAAAVCFLLSPQASWITGQVLVVDGGLSLTGF